MKFNVEITEFLSKTVEIEAESISEAKVIAEENWLKGEPTLTADDFVDVKFNVKSEAE